MKQWLSAWTVVVLLAIGAEASGAEVVEHPFLGVTHVTRTETSPRTVRMHIVTIDLTVPGIRFKLTPPGGTRETLRQTTLAFISAEQAQVGVNSHFFLPFPSADLNAMLIGLAASEGVVYSAFEAPVQSYALVTNAPAINIGPENQASIVHHDPAIADGFHVIEPVVLWNALAGSAQIVTDGVRTVPVYRDAMHPEGLLTPGGPANYSNDNSWYSLANARTVIGLTQDNQTLVIFTVDRAGGSLGLSVGEAADILIRDYGVYNALNLDGGGSTTLAMESPFTHVRSVVNVSSDNPAGRAVASSLAVFAPYDVAAPVTRVMTMPAANGEGWLRGNVVVSLEAADGVGGLVKSIEYALSGALAEGPITANGASASVPIAAEGVTTITYGASDYVDNREAPRAFVVRLDRTPPSIVTWGTPQECMLWPADGRMTHVGTVSATDTLSGLADLALDFTVISNESTEARDDFQAVSRGDGSFDLYLRASRHGSGRGRLYHVTATAQDRAGNTSTEVLSCQVPHDRRRP